MDATLDERHQIGANHPPLADILTQETVDLRHRADELVATAALMDVTDEDTAGRATALVKMIKDHAADIEKARQVRKEPNIQEGRTIDGHFNAMKAPLIGEDKGKLGGAAGPLDQKITALRKQREAEAAAERARLEEAARMERENARKAEEARQAAEAEQRRAAAEAERKIEEAQAAAAAAGHAALADKLAREQAEARAERDRHEAQLRERNLQAEIDRRKAEDAARELERLAAETKPAAIGGYGAKASGREKWTATITDLKLALKHAMKVDEEAIRAAVQGIYDRQVKAKVRSLPGATVTEDSTTTYR